MNYSSPDSSVHGMLQARILEWVAIPFYRKSLDRGIEPRSPASQVDSLTSEPPEEPYALVNSENYCLFCSHPCSQNSLNFSAHAEWFKYDHDWSYHEATNCLSFSMPISTGWSDNSLDRLVQILVSSTQLRNCWVYLLQAKSTMDNSVGRFPVSYNLPLLGHTDLCYILPRALVFSILLQIDSEDMLILYNQIPTFTWADNYNGLFLIFSPYFSNLII